MKKKIVTIALVVALLAIMVSGSLAYFTAEDKVENTFTIGSVKIEIYENDVPTESDTISFGSLIPIADPSAPTEDDNYVEKVVQTKNTGLNDAYIRTHIAIPTALVNYLYLDLDETGWTRRQDSAATVEGVEYTVFTYDHDALVAAGDFTGELLKGVYLGANVDLEADADGNLWFILRDGDGKKIHDSGFLAHKKNANGTYTSVTVSILVASEAIQSRGFDNAADALDSGFGQDNPWN